VRYIPSTPDRLVRDLTGWIVGLDQLHPRIGIDGAVEIGAAELADSIATSLQTLGRPVIRTSTSWWWRPASLRLEFGRTDIDTLLDGWVDGPSIRRELLDPLGPGGSGCYLRRLRDPDTDRSIREARVTAPQQAVLLLDGPFLRTARLPLDAVVHLQVSAATLARAMPADRQWWVEAFDRYRVDERPAEGAAVVVAYDHPAAPAVSWAIDR
jgi:hypothetical protein